MSIDRYVYIYKYNMYIYTYTIGYTHTHTYILQRHCIAKGTESPMTWVTPSHSQGKTGNQSQIDTHAHRATHNHRAGMLIQNHTVPGT